MDQVLEDLDHEYGSSGPSGSRLAPSGSNVYKSNPDNAENSRSRGVD